jgi:hypothetical protein
MDNQDIGKYELSAYWAVLASQLDFAKNLNSMAGQARTERAWSVSSGFYDNCKKHKPRKKGCPRLKKNKHMVLVSTKPVDGSFPKSGDISLSLTVLKWESLKGGEPAICISIN